MTPVAGRPRETSRGRADYGTDWSLVRQRPQDADESTSDEPGNSATPPGRSAPEDSKHVPVWVHRMHGDGLPSTSADGTAPRPGSQRFIKRWKDASGGY